MFSPDEHDTVDGLKHLIADYQTIYQKARSFHWSVTGSHFFNLHEQFESLYRTLSDRIDELAERVRGLDEHPPRTYSRLLQLSGIEEVDEALDAHEMVQELIRDYEHMQTELSEVRELAEQADDTATVTMLDDIEREQAQTLYMLRSFDTDHH